MPAHAVGPKGLHRLRAGHLQLRIGTHSREPYLALMPECVAGAEPKDPTIVVEAAYIVETEEQLIKALQLWMSDASQCQVQTGAHCVHLPAHALAGSSASRSLLPAVWEVALPCVPAPPQAGR